MNTWDKIDEVSLPDKEDFYSTLHMEKLQMLIICMPVEYLKSLIIKVLVIIMVYMFKVIHYYLQIYFRILETNVLKYMNLKLLIFICSWISMTSLFKKDK